MTLVVRAQVSLGTLLSVRYIRKIRLKICEKVLPFDRWSTGMTEGRMS